MIELAAWAPAIVTIVGIGVGWGAARQKLNQQGKDIAEIKIKLSGPNGLPAYVTRTEWDKFEDECHDRHDKLNRK